MACAANGDGVVPPPKGEADAPVGPGPPDPKGEVTDAEAVVVAPLCPVLELDACAACTSMGSVKSRNALCAFFVPVAYYDEDIIDPLWHCSMCHIEISPVLCHHYQC